MSWPSVVDVITGEWRLWGDEKREDYRAHLRSVGVPDEIINRCSRVEVRGDALRLRLWHEVDGKTHLWGGCDRVPPSDAGHNDACEEWVDL